MQITIERELAERIADALDEYANVTNFVDKSAWELRAALAAQPAEPVAWPREADPFTYIIQHLNGNPYSLTKAECIHFIEELRDSYAAPPAPAAVPPDDVGLPPKYMLAKLQMVMPLFQEARDALPIMTEVQRKLHGVSPTLADRMDAAGTFSLDDWFAAAGDKP